MKELLSHVYVLFVLLSNPSMYMASAASSLYAKMGDKLKKERVAELSNTWRVNFSSNDAAGRARYVVKEGVLTKTDRNQQSRPVTFLLFNDLIAYGDRNPLTGGLRLRCKIPLNRKLTVILDKIFCSFSCLPNCILVAYSIGKNACSSIISACILPERRKE